MYFLMHYLYFTFRKPGWFYGNFSLCCEIRVENLDVFDVDVLNIDMKNLKLEVGLMFPQLKSRQIIILLSCLESLKRL